MYRLGPDDELVRGLALVEAAMVERRWNDAIRQCDRLLKLNGAAPVLQDIVATRRTQAELERSGQPAYERFVSSAADSTDYDELLRLYRDIPAQSGYSKLAAETYSNVFSLFAAAYLRRAEAARVANRCSAFRDIVRLVLAIEPHDETALLAQSRPCRDQRRQTVATATSASPEAQPPQE